MFTCPYWDCTNRNELGYCKTTTCINPYYSYEPNSYTSDNTTVTQPNYITYTTDAASEVNADGMERM